MSVCVFSLKCHLARALTLQSIRHKVHIAHTWHPILVLEGGCRPAESISILVILNQVRDLVVQLQILILVAPHLRQLLLAKEHAELAVLTHRVEVGKGAHVAV